MTTIYDVAKKANVSAMTVSRVINQATTIKEETRLRVLKAIEELDYIPNRSARSLTSKDSKLLSLIITDITNPFFTSVARGAEDKANEMGYQLVFSNSDENIEKESSYIRSAISRGIDGMLLVSTGDDSKKNTDLLSKYSIPFVLIDREIQGVSTTLITGDNQSGTFRLMEHLVQSGHKRIALVTGPPSISNIREREASYLQFLKQENLPYNDVFRTDLTKIKIEPYVEKILRLPKEQRPTAIFAINNFLAVKLINQLKTFGINVPEDISVVCFDDPSPIPDYNPFLTVISQPAYKFGYMGMEILINRIEGKIDSSPQRIVLPSELLIRQSTRKI